jgi:hypothetical protein
MSNKIITTLKKGIAVANYSLFTLTFSLLFTACSDDNGSNPTLGEPSTFVLNTPSYSTVPIDLATSTEIPFTWSSPDYGFPVAAIFQLEASIDGNFTISTDEAALDESGETIPNYIQLPEAFYGGYGIIQAKTLAQAVKLMGNWDEGETPETQTLVIRASATAGDRTIYSNSVNIVVVPAAEVAPSWPLYIYEIGNESGWATVHALSSPAQDGVYTGYYWLDGGFKFKPNEGNWDGDWGQDPAGAYGTLVVDGEEDCNDPGKSFPDQAQPAGFYQVKVDLNEMTWALTPITSISIIGGFNDWAGDVDMTYNTKDGCWEVTTDAVSGEYKFRANHDWAINWGGTEDNLTQDGANLSSDGGTHTYKLFLSCEGNHYVVIE